MRSLQPKYGTRDYVNDESYPGKTFYVLAASAAMYPTVANDLRGINDEGVPMLHNTIASALSACVANRGDVIKVLPGHTESVSTTITVSVAGVKIVGIGHGTNRPNLTQATTGSSGVMTISAANVWVENIYFTGSATGTNERFLILTASTATYFTAKNCVFEAKSKNLDSVTVNKGCDHIRFIGCEFLGTVAGPDTAIDILPMTTSIVDVRIIDCFFDYLTSAGVDDGCIQVSVSNSATCTRMLIDGCRAMGLADGEQFVRLSPAAGTTGLVTNCRISAADATDVIIVSNLLSVADTMVTQPGAYNGGQVLTHWPLATPAF